MSQFEYHNWLDSNHNGQDYLIEFGGNSQIRWAFDTDINQLVLVNLWSGSFTFCYSGYASTAKWENSFTSGPPGTVITIDTTKTAYFSDNMNAEYDPAFTPTLLNTFVTASRVMITPSDEEDVYYDFDFKIESVDPGKKTAVSIVGNKIIKGQAIPCKK